MNKWIWGLLISSLLLFSAMMVSAQDTNGRALSLKILQEKLKGHPDKKKISNALLQLAGLKRITGYVIDEKNHDIILIGNLDDALPPLFLEDFVIALRNAWFKYAERKGNTCYFSNPGCSIDPDEDVVNNLFNLSMNSFNESNAKGVNAGIDTWNRICRSPQTVRVMGIPFNTHFAKIMVNADYDMKGVVDGSDNLELPDFISLIDMEFESAKKTVTKSSGPAAAMNRFWFYPGKNSFHANNKVMIMDKSQVILLTEEEYNSAKGSKRKGSFNAHAQQFAKNFTKKFPEIAQKRSIYLELENLFRFVSIAKIIKFKNAHSEAGIDLEYFLNDFPVSITDVSKELPGRPNVKQFEIQQNAKGGYRIHKLWLPSCGGVGIEISIDAKNIIKDKTGSLIMVRNMVFDARPTPEALFWDYPQRKKVQIEPSENIIKASISDRSKHQGLQDM